MSDHVLLTGNVEQDLTALTQLVQNRDNYRKGGRPCPEPLSDPQGIIRRLELMKPILHKRINRELSDQAVSDIQAIASAHTASLMSKLRRTDETKTYMPETPSEQLLRQVKSLKAAVALDAEKQERARWHLEVYKYCRTACWYPDQCCQRSKYREECVLWLLRFSYTEGNWWQKLVGRTYVPKPLREDELPVLSRIRNSYYYDPSHNEHLRNIQRSSCYKYPDLCKIWILELSKGRPWRCPYCHLTPYDLGYRSGAP